MFRVVFLDDTGPRRIEHFEDNFNEVDDREFLSLPFRTLTGFASTDPRLKERCEFIRVPLTVPRPQPRSAGLARHADGAFAISNAESVLSHRPDLIAVSLYAWNTTQALRTLLLCKAIDSRVRIVAGGPDVLGQAEWLLQSHPAIDVAVEGDGEQPFLSLLRYFCLGEGNPAELPSVTSRENGCIRVPRGIHYMSDLDTIPSTVTGYTLKQITRGRICYYEASRGCPYQCTYCQFSKGTRKVRSHSIERVLADLREMRRLGVQRITFVEPMFTLNASRAEKMMQYLLEEYPEAQVFVEMNLDRVPQRLIKPLKALLDQQRMFCGIGVQSTNEATLANVGRRSDLAALKTNAKLLFEGGLRAEYQIMAGLPGDTFDDILATLDYGYDLLPGLYPSIFPVMVLPGTPMRATAAESGVVYDPVPPYYVLKTASLTAEDMRCAWILYRLLPRLIGPITAFAKVCGIHFPSLYRDVFSRDLFRYTYTYGFDNPVADFFFVGHALRDYLTGRAADAEAAELISENIDLLTVLSTEYNGSLPEYFLNLPSRVSLNATCTFSAAGGSMRIYDDMLGAHAFFFRHYAELDLANRPYLEKAGGEYVTRGNDRRSAYILLGGVNKVVYGTDCLSGRRSTETAGAFASYSGTNR